MTDHEPQPLSDAALDEMEARCRAATPGPWRKEDAPAGMRAEVLGNVYIQSSRMPVADEAFILAARTDLPRVLAELRRLRALARATGPLHEQYVEWCRGAGEFKDAPKWYDHLAALARAAGGEA